MLRLNRRFPPVASRLLERGTAVVKSKFLHSSCTHGARPLLGRGGRGQRDRFESFGWNGSPLLTAMRAMSGTPAPGTGSKDKDEKAKPTDGTMVPVSTKDSSTSVKLARRPPQSKVAMVVKMGSNIAKGAADIIRNPKKTWSDIKEVIHHYRLGGKLLWGEVKLSSQILQRVVEGHAMTRRERMQLIRTAIDLLRVVPLVVFLIVPFMEFLLPFALKIWPNMLPSTFQEKYKQQENMKKEIQMRLALTGFFSDTLTEMAKLKKRGSDDDGDGAVSQGKDIAEFIEKARIGEDLPNDTVIRIARHFKDELTLANIPRPQLVTMCQYMNLSPYGADAFLRFQLRSKLRSLKEDDRRILWEGVDTLSETEAQEACQQRGMRSLGLSEYAYKVQLREWLDLSVQKNIPISLLIMSRAFMLRTSSTRFAKPEDVMKETMSSLDSETINEVVLAAAKADEQTSIDITERKLEQLQFQAEMIEEERDDYEIATKKKEKDMEKEEKEAVQIQARAQQESSKQVSKTASGSKNKFGETSSVKDNASEAAEELRTKLADSIVDANGNSSGSGSTTGTEESSFESNKSKSSNSSEDENEDVETIDAQKIEALMSSTGEERERMAKELTLYEMQALGDLARGSAIEREKAELAMIEASIDAVVIESAKKAPVDPVIRDMEENRQMFADEGAHGSDNSKAGSSNSVSIAYDEYMKNNKMDDKALQESTFETASPPSEQDPSPSALDSEKERQRLEKEHISDAHTQAAMEAHSYQSGDTIEDEEEEYEDEEEEEVNYEDNNARALKATLESMVDRLKSRVVYAETSAATISAEEAFPMLDLDGDGKLSREELKEAVQHILKRQPTDEEADRLIDLLDTDNDGSVSVMELMELIKEKKAKIEVEALESKVKEAHNLKEDAQKEKEKEKEREKEEKEKEKEKEKEEAPLMK